MLLATPAAADLPSADRIAAARAELASRPADPLPHLRLLRLLVEGAAPAEALAEADSFCALHPEDTRVEEWRARALVALSRPDEAEAALDRRVAHEPLDAGALGLRAGLRAERGDYEGAALDWDAALARGPWVDAYLGRAHALARIGEVELARVGLAEGLRRTGGAAVLREEAVALARRTGAYDEALALIDTLLARHAAASRWRVLRAAVLHDAGREAEAHRELTRALADAEAQVRRRRTPLALLERGRALLALGRRDEARADLRQAALRAPALTDARRLLAAAEADR